RLVVSGPRSRFLVLLPAGISPVAGGQLTPLLTLPVTAGLGGHEEAWLCAVPGRADAGRDFQALPGTVLVSQNPRARVRLGLGGVAVCELEARQATSLPHGLAVVDPATFRRLAFEA